jgi:hypothetical protein
VLDAPKLEGDARIKIAFKSTCTAQGQSHLYASTMRLVFFSDPVVLLVSRISLGSMASLVSIAYLHGHSLAGVSPSSQTGKLGPAAAPSDGAIFLRGCS